MASDMWSDKVQPNKPHKPTTEHRERVRQKHWKASDVSDIGKGVFMKKVSIRLSDSDYDKLEMFRGSKSISDYIRMLLAAHHEEARNESAEFQNLIRDVNIIKTALNTSLKDFPGRKDLLALATYIKEAVSISNPPAYANYEDKLREHFQTLKAQMDNEA